MAPERHRLFLALWPDAATRGRIAESAAALRQRLHPAGRWNDAARYHLTLHFLGEYPLAPEAVMQRALEAAQLVTAPAFTLRLDQAASFDEGAMPWWLGPAAPCPALKLLWTRLREALREGAVPYESRRRFVPHVTLLRDSPQRLPAAPVAAVDWPVRDFCLIHSVSGAGSEYRVLGSWPLLDTAQEPPAAQRDLWEN